VVRSANGGMCPVRGLASHWSDGARAAVLPRPAAATAAYNQLTRSVSLA